MYYGKNGAIIFGSFLFSNTMNFSIIGFGEVGSLVAALINGRFNNSTINILDFPEEISGRILDFQHACACNNNNVIVNDKNQLISTDVVIYSAGFCNAPGESRYSVAQNNKALIEEIFKDLHFNRNTLVIAVTNPVEPVSMWINEALNRQCSVIGTGTSLDTFRLQFILSTYFKCSMDRIETLVIGEHGEKMIPVYSSTRINGQEITELVSREVLDQFTNELVHSAKMIRKTEKATKYGIAETCLKLILSYFGFENSLRTAVSMPIEKEPFKGIFVSQPVEIGFKNIKVVDLKLTHEEQLLFDEAVQFISGYGN